jgi:hypothetical protein
MSTFKELSKIDVSKHLEEKQGLSYLQWMACWALIKEYDPSATYEVMTCCGVPYFCDNTEVGAFVGVRITVKGVDLTEYLPVLDYRNKAIAGAALNTFDINSAIKRCLVKCAAMHGLGAQVYIDGNGTALDLSKGLTKKKTQTKAAPKSKTAW